jgi:hypothetical protein
MKGLRSAPIIIARRYFAGNWHDCQGDRRPTNTPVAGPYRIFAFLARETNEVVASIPPKAMHAVLSPAEVQVKMATPPSEALALQKPLADGALCCWSRSSTDVRWTDPDSRKSPSANRCAIGRAICASPEVVFDGCIYSIGRCCPDRWLLACLYSVTRGELGPPDGRAVTHHGGGTS